MPLLRRGTRHKVVEDVEVALTGGGPGDTTLLEIVVECLHTAQAAALCELELRVFPKMGYVQVEKCASIPERFEDELDGRDLALELGALLAWAADTELNDRFDGQLTAFRLATAHLTAASVTCTTKSTLTDVPSDWSIGYNTHLSKIHWSC